MINNTLEFHAQWRDYYSNTYPTADKSIILTYDDMSNINHIGNISRDTAQYLLSPDHITSILELNLIWC